MAVVPPSVPQQQQREIIPPPEDKKDGVEVIAASQSAIVTVHLPADATLYVDDVHCPLNSDTRTFRTPDLEPGREYYYTIRAEVVRNGQRRTESQRVIVAAGRQVNVEFNNFTPLRTVSR